jgi:hypothetical protein
MVGYPIGGYPPLAPRPAPGSERMFFWGSELTPALLHHRHRPRLAWSRPGSWRAAPGSRLLPGALPARRGSRQRDPGRSVSRGGPRMVRSRSAHGPVGARARVTRKPLRFRPGSPFVAGRRSLFEPAATNCSMAPRSHFVATACAPRLGGGSSLQSLGGECREGPRSHSMSEFPARRSALLPALCRGLLAAPGILTGLSRPSRQPRLSGFRQARNPRVIPAVSRRDSPGTVGGTCVAVLAARNGNRPGRHP